MSLAVTGYISAPFSNYVSLFFINMKLKTVDVLLPVMRARRTENMKMTMKRSKVVQSMRRRKIMH